MGRAHLILLLGFLLLLGLEDYDLSRQQATSSFSFLRGASAASVGKAYRGRRRCHTRRDHIPRPAAYHDEPHSHHHHHSKHKDSYDRDVHYSRHSAAGDRSQVAKDYSAFSALAGPSFLELDSKQFPQLSQLFQNQQQMPQMPQMPQMAQMQQTPSLSNDPRSIMAMSQPQPLPTGINVLDQISHASPRQDQTPWSLPKMVNDLGLAIIATNRQWFSNCTYFNGNVWMVGFSHMCSATNLASMRDSVCSGCFQGGAAYGLTLQEAIGVLKQDVHPCEGFIGAEADVSRLTSNQFSSLVSFCDGVGQSNLQGSSFLHMLQAGQWDQIPEELVKWDKIGNGQFSQQMQLRRRNEAMLFTTPDSAKTLSQPPMPSPSQLRRPPQPDNQQFASPQDMVMSIRSRRAHAYDPPSFYDYKRSESDHRSPPKGDDDDEDCEEELGSSGGREQSRLSTRGALLNDVEGAQFPRLKEERQDAKAAGKHKASSKAEIWESAESVPDESGGYILPNPFGHSAGELESSREGYTYHHNFFVGPGPSDYFMDHWSHPDPSVTHPAPVDGKAMPADTRPWGDVPQTGSSGSDRHASHW